MDFFDSELYEVENKTDGVRYVLRRNPVRETEMVTNCQERVKKIRRYINGRIFFFPLSNQVYMIQARSFE